MASPYVLAIDQGTTGTRAVVYAANGTAAGTAARELTQHYPKPGWVEHDADEIWATVAEVVPRALAAAKVEAKQIAAVGVTNQRETVVLWDRASGKPVGRAIVWQDRRTTDFCRERADDQEWLHVRTGLVLDPYFSATKIRWMLEADAGLMGRAERGDIAFGTVDSFLIWRLTGGKSHLTDVSNASRTLLLDLCTGQWDRELCAYFGVPPKMLPELRPSAGDYGVTHGLGFLPDGIPVAGAAGDQQAALFGQCAFAAGEAKCTYGTGAFFLQHTGEHPVFSKHRMLTTFAATTDAKPQYALEGSVFVAGAAVQWLRDGLKLLPDAAASEALAARSDPAEPVLFVPGFVGLGAPHWVPEARGVLFGLTRGTTAADLARAALEGVAFEVADLIAAAEADTGLTLPALRADGGMTRNEWFLRCQADVLGRPVVRASQVESTALGAAYLAGLKVGVWPSAEHLRTLTAGTATFAPQLPDAERTRRVERWRRAVRAVIDFYTA
jgi:glycerol kinase